MDLKFEVPLLKGAINPADGMAYMVGFQIWDSFASRLEGLCRLRVVKETDQLPVNAELFKEGLLLSFSEELDQKLALDPASYNVSSWEYQRTKNYGSAQYKAEGIPGADTRFVHSFVQGQEVGIHRHRQDDQDHAIGITVCVVWRLGVCFFYSQRIT